MINCKNLIIANFALEQAIFTRYLDVLTSTFNAMEDSKNHNLEVVGSEEFVSRVLADPQSKTLLMIKIQEYVWLDQE